MGLACRVDQQLCLVVSHAMWSSWVCTLANFAFFEVPCKWKGITNGSCPPADILGSLTPILCLWRIVPYFEIADLKCLQKFLLGWDWASWIHRLSCLQFVLPEFRKHLDNTLRYMVWFLGCSAWTEGLDSMFPIGPFQLEVFCVSKLILWEKFRVQGNSAVQILI